MKTVVLNASLVNYDGKIDFSNLADEVIIYDVTPEEKILERVQGCEVVVTKEMPVKGDIIRQFPSSVKLIVEAGTGYNNLDLQAIQEKGIALCNVAAYSTQRVAHTVIMMMLNLASSMQQQMQMLAHHNYDNFKRHLMVDHVELNGNTLGIVGYGNIGKEVIQVALAMGMKILVATRTHYEDQENIHFTSLEEVMRLSDFVSLHCPLNESTHHMIDAEKLALMKPTAFLINTARGALIDEQALIHALTNHQLAGAGLDVQEHEPLDCNSPLFHLPSVIVTPHMGWRGLETRQRLVQMIQENIDSFAQGEKRNRII